MYVEQIRSLYAWTIDHLKHALRLRNVRCMNDANKAELVELIIVDLYALDQLLQVGRAHRGK